MDREFVERVLDLVERIPLGRAVSYGAIAEHLAAGYGPRYVGRVMAMEGHAVPWWRVVRADGAHGSAADGRGAAALARGGHAGPQRPGRHEAGALAVRRLSVTPVWWDGGHARVRPAAAQRRVDHPAGARRQPAGRARPLRLGSRRTAAGAGRSRRRQDHGARRARRRPRRERRAEPRPDPGPDVQPQGGAGGAVPHRPPPGPHDAHDAGDDVPRVLLRPAAGRAVADRLRQPHPAAQRSRERRR